MKSIESFIQELDKIKSNVVLLEDEADILVELGRAYAVRDLYILESELYKIKILYNLGKNIN